MKEIHFDPDAFPKLALLIKESACFKSHLEEHYVNHLNVPVVALSLEYTKSNKITAKAAREYLVYILETLKKNNITTLYVADSQYFKVLTKKQTTESHYGYVLDCALDGFTDFKVIYGVNYQALFHNEKLRSKLKLSLQTVNDYFDGTYSEIGSSIIHFAHYPDTLEDVAKALNELHKQPSLACDIETYGLQLDQAKPATIAFAWNEHEGVAFNVEESGTIELVKQFFKDYTGTLLFHNATFDIKCIIYHWFMNEPLDSVGLLNGLQTMYRSIHDTKIITYLSTNSTAGNTLGLKANAFEFAGNYAVEDIDDITKIDRTKLLEYNLVDTLSTWYVYNKYYPVMVKEDQADLYYNLMLPALKNITHMELVGMPLDMEVVGVLEQKLLSVISDSKQKLASASAVKQFEWTMQRKEFVAKNAQLKKKLKPLEEFKTEFNPGSTTQVAELLYEQLGLPVLDQTNKGNPSVGNSTLKALLSHLTEKYGLSDEQIEAGSKSSKD